MYRVTLKQVLDTYYLFRMDKTGPKYLDTALTEESKQELFQKRCLKKYPHVWGFYEDYGKWIFFETDKMGRVIRLEEFVSERDILLFADERIGNISVNRNKSREMVREELIERYLRYKFEKYRNSEAVDTFINQLKEYPELFDEMYRCLDEWGFSKTNPNRVTVEGFTAEKLIEDYNLTLPEAYEYMIHLNQEPKDVSEVVRIRITDDEV